MRTKAVKEHLEYAEKARTERRTMVVRATFAVAFVAFGLAFLALDYTIMHAQGLTLIYGN